MKIVIAGALGHIGSAAIRRLPQIFPEAQIVMIDNMMTQRYCSLFNLPEKVKYRFIQADVLEMDLEPVFDKADAVLQLAAITDATSSFENKDKVEHNNYNATAKIAQACYKVGCPMLHMSSTRV